MNKAIGMVEYSTVSTGMQAADLIVKTADVEILEASTVCPGKYMVIYAGDLSSVRAATESCKEKFPTRLIDTFVLGNPHEDVLPAICGATEVSEVEALGVFETYSAAAAVVAADNTVKTSMVKLIEIRLARGMCGKSYVLITGSIAAVSAAIERATAQCADSGMFLDSAVIPRPSKDLWKNIL